MPAKAHLYLSVNQTFSGVRVAETIAEISNLIRKVRDDSEYDEMVPLTLPTGKSMLIHEKSIVAVEEL